MQLRKEDIIEYYSSLIVWKNKKQGLKQLLEFIEDTVYTDGKESELAHELWELYIKNVARDRYSIYYSQLRTTYYYDVGLLLENKGFIPEKDDEDERYNLEAFVWLSRKQSWYSERYIKLVREANKAYKRVTGRSMYVRVNRFNSKFSKLEKRSLQEVEQTNGIKLKDEYKEEEFYLVDDMVEEWHMYRSDILSGLKDYTEIEIGRY